MAKKSYLIETVRIGNQVKVTACDPETGTEAVIMGPSNTAQKDLNELAIRKLHYILGKQPQ